jgi:hypothetical protein
MTKHKRLNKAGWTRVDGPCLTHVPRSQTKARGRDPHEPKPANVIDVVRFDDIHILRSPSLDKIIIVSI